MLVHRLVVRQACCQQQLAVLPLPQPWLLPSLEEVTKQLAPEISTFPSPVVGLAECSETCHTAVELS